MNRDLVREAYQEYAETRDVSARTISRLAEELGFDPARVAAYIEDQKVAIRFRAVRPERDSRADTKLRGRDREDYDAAITSGDPDLRRLANQRLNQTLLTESERPDPRLRQRS